MSQKASEFRKPIRNSGISDGKAYHGEKLKCEESTAWGGGGDFRLQFLGRIIVVGPRLHSTQGVVHQTAIFPNTLPTV